jgi:hypothetical protein
LRVDPARRPSWYQAQYAFAAANLNTAVAAWTIYRYISEPSDEANRAAMADLDEFLADCPGPPDGAAALNAAAHATRDLVSATITTLAATKSRTRRRPRFLLTPHRRRRLAEHRLHQFLARQVYDTSVTLLCGVLQLRDAVYGAPKRKERAVGEISRKEILAELDSPTGPDHAAIVKSLSARAGLDARVRYNLACYQSRALEYDLAIAQLRTAMQDAAPVVLKLICLQAATDPALAPVRTQRTGEFSQLLKRYLPPAPAGSETHDEEKQEGAEQLPNQFEKVPPWFEKRWVGSGIESVVRGLTRLRDSGSPLREELQKRDSREIWREDWRRSQEIKEPMSDAEQERERAAESLLIRVLWVAHRADSAATQTSTVIDKEVS